MARAGAVRGIVHHVAAVDLDGSLRGLAVTWATPDRRQSLKVTGSLALSSVRIACPRSSWHRSPIARVAGWDGKESR